MKLDEMFLGAVFGFVSCMTLHGWGEKEGGDHEPDVFGFWGRDFESFPECKTDATNFENWPTNLIYLNGVWTAACVDEFKKREAQK